MKETKELAVAICKVVNAADRVMADGRVSLMDLPHLMPVLIALPAAFGGIDKVPGELKDLGISEAEELSACVAAELSLSNKAAEAIVEQIVGVALQLAASVIAVRGAKEAEAKAKAEKAAELAQQEAGAAV